MQFVLICRDGTDDKALERRMAAREAHLAGCAEYKARGEHMVGAALLNDKGTMIGSMMLVDFPSRKDLDAWLEKEAYVTAGVWQDIEIIPAKVGPSFEKLFAK